MNVSDRLLVSGFLIICVALWWLAGRLRGGVVVTARLFLAGWIGSAGVIFLNLITYREVFTIGSFLFLSLFVTAFVVGTFVMHQREPDRRIGYAENCREFSPHIYGVLVLLSVVSILLQAGDFSQSMRVALTDFGELRALHWASIAADEGVTVTDVISSAGRTSAFLLAISLPISYRNHRRVRIAVSIVAIIFLILETFGTAGRATIFYMTFCLIFILLSVRKPSERRERVARSMRDRVLLGGGIVAFLYFFMVVFPTFRYGGQEIDYDRYLQFREESSISSWVKSATGIVPGLGAMAYGSDYFSLPIVKMTDHLENGRVDEWYYLGAYSFAIPAKLYAALGGENFNRDARLRIEDFMSQQGYAAVRPWATSARDLAIDFGKIGAVVASFLFGLLSQFIFGRSRRGQGVEWAVLSALIALICALFAFTSPLNISLVGNSLIASAFLAALSKVRSR